MPDWLLSLSATFNSSNNLFTQIVCLAASNNVTYSASAVKVDIDFYFLDYQLTGPLPIITIYPLTDRPMDISDAKTESENMIFHIPLDSLFECEPKVKVIEWLMVPFKYLRIRQELFQCLKIDKEL